MRIRGLPSSLSLPGLLLPRLRWLFALCGLLPSTSSLVRAVGAELERGRQRREGRELLGFTPFGVSHGSSVPVGESRQSFGRTPDPRHREGKAAASPETPRPRLLDGEMSEGGKKGEPVAVKGGGQPSASPLTPESPTQTAPFILGIVVVAASPAEARAGPEGLERWPLLSDGPRREGETEDEEGLCSASGLFH